MDSKITAAIDELVEAARGRGHLASARAALETAIEQERIRAWNQGRKDERAALSGKETDGE
jgi:hypothetical protein